MKKPESAQHKKDSGWLGRGKHWRVHTLAFFVFFAALSILFRLYGLSVTSSRKYEAIAENQHVLSEEISPHRGELFLADTAGAYPLAVNRERFLVYVVPKDIDDRTLVSSRLAAITGVDRAEIEHRLTRMTSLFEVVKKKLSDDEVRSIRDLHAKGVYLLPETYRYYPGGELASQVVGFMGFDRDTVAGRYGVESYWENELRGNPGSMMQEQDAGGRWIPLTDREVRPAKNGDDLTLTIRRGIQYEVEKRLKESVEEYEADGGTVVVMEPSTGRVLAMVSYPQFDPNEYAKVKDMSVFLNPAVSLPYEAGSVMKAFTEAIGLDAGKITPESTYTDTGVVNEGGFAIRNAEDKVYGVQTMTNALEQSINTGMIHIERLVGNKKFVDYLRRFGFGQKTGIELPSELAGDLHNLGDIRSNVNFYTASFGQGITVTPLQLASAYSALANGGVLMKPRIVEKIARSDGSEERIEPQEVRRVVSADTAEKIGVMLRSVVLNGHGKKAAVSGYAVGGKTGTAQIARTDGPGYEEGKNIGSFVGYAPLDEPKFTVAVKIVNPRKAEWAESSAAPVFQKVMKFLLEYERIPPTETRKNQS
jgi:cell division protein FtsI/penicillin-binding protein 2